MCSIEKVYLKILQNLRWKTTETLTQVFSCEFCKISKNTFVYIIPPVAASDLCRSLFLNKFLGLPWQGTFPVNFAIFLRTRFEFSTCGCFFQILPKLNKRRAGQTQFKNGSKTKQNTNLKLFKLFMISKEEKMWTWYVNIWFQEWQENKSLTKEIAFCKNCHFLFKYF